MLPKSPHHIGYIDPACNIAGVIKTAFVDVRYLCHFHYKVSPRMSTSRRYRSKRRKYCPSTATLRDSS
ncbi:hypothetical protein QR680_007807 [Steinernema hermaphroditum]|uniref:Uncharacterized protein n=1 Tax=Steinernema hermaphroditum TaxID=289476 RepID=A0AA39M6J2_9BILA|nr:hypothetical protein QR680_007807 [Steinernema hermaphroditum]